MRSGSLRHKITFQLNNEIKNEFNEITNVWADFTQVFAQIVPLRGDEKYQSQHLKTEVNHKIRVRYQDNLTSKMKIIYGDREFNIDSIINHYEKNKELQIMATEVF